MTQVHSTSGFSDMLTAVQSWANAVAAGGTENFDRVALFSLACYLVFAVTALQYALKPWAEKVMLASMVAGAAASLLLHLSLRHTPSYVGEGPLWKFVALSQYLPLAVVSLGGMYLLYRMGSALLKKRK